MATRFTAFTSSPYVRGCLLLLLATLAYLPALRGGFVWDDDKYVTENPLLTASDGLQRIWFSAHFQSQYFPLVYTTFRYERLLWGLHPFGYHLVNVLLHGVNALLAWLVLRRLKAPGAWLAAAIFALHPVNVESVAWITELKNVESLFFFLLALLAWMKFAERNVQGSWVYYGLALAAYVLALFAKTTACVLPVAMALVLWLRRERFAWAHVFQVLPFLLWGLVMGLVSVWWEGQLGAGEGPEPSAGLLQRCIIAGRALWFYALKLLYPAHLCFSYPRWEVSTSDAVQFLPFIGCVLVALLLWHWRRRIPRGAIAGVVFFVAALAPLLGFFNEYTFRYSYVADHYQYAAAIGLIALAVAGIQAAEARLKASLENGRDASTRRPLPPTPRLRRAGRDVRSSKTDALTPALSQRERENAPAAEGLVKGLSRSESLPLPGGEGWGEGALVVLKQVLRQSGPRVPTWAFQAAVLAVLGCLTWQQCGAYRNSQALWRDTLEKNPASWMAHLNLGVDLFKQGRLDEALEHYRAAVDLHPNGDTEQGNFGLALLEKGNYAEAIEHLKAALAINPNMFSVHNGLGLAYFKMGDVVQAEAHYRRALQLQPDASGVWLNLSKVLARRGKTEEALQCCRKAVAFAPGQADPLCRLGEMLLQTERFDEAATVCRDALKLAPNRPDVLINLGNALAAQTNYAAAVVEYHKALALEPDNAAYHYNLGSVLAAAGQNAEARQEFAEALRIKKDFPQAQRQLLMLTLKGIDPKAVVSFK